MMTVTPQAEGGFDVKRFGAMGDGVTDDTASIQSALDAAAETGGRVALPPAKYRVEGGIKIPPGVHVAGSAPAPQYSDPLLGTIILAMAGRDREEDPALFELASCSSVSGLTVYYPEQVVNDIRPYPWTFRMFGDDITLENVTLVNSYNGIRVGPENCRHRIRSVCGCVLRRGIYVEKCTDIGRIDNVQFHGHWWWAGSVNGDVELVNRYMIEHCEAFIFARTDWEYVTNTFVFPVKTGYRFIANEHGMSNGQFCGIGADYAQRCLVVEAIQPMGLLITNGQFVAFAGDNPVQVEIGSECEGSVRLENCAFWGPSAQNVVSRGKGFLSLSNCYLGSGRGVNKPLVDVSGGRLQVRGCSFATLEPSIAIRSGVKHAIVSENNGSGGVEIINEIREKAMIQYNELPERLAPAKQKNTGTDGFRQSSF